MRILALDTSTEACSAAISTESGLFGVFEEVGRGHAEKILTMIDTVLRRAGVALTDLDGIAAGVGPGAFTGVRIGVSVAQGLAFGAGLPVVAVTSLEALAMRLARNGGQQLMACLDARMGEVYWGCFQADPVCGLAPGVTGAVGAAASIVLPAPGPWSGIGRGFAAYPALASLPGMVVEPGAANALPDASDVARLGAYRLKAGGGVDPEQLTPVYLRDKVAFTEAERAMPRS